MKSFFSLVFALLFVSLGLAQTGINTTQPKATLDIRVPAGYQTGKAAGLALPELTGNQIDSIQIGNLRDGTLIWCTTPSTVETSPLQSAGLYVFQSNQWNRIGMYTPATMPEPQPAVPLFFYPPAVSIDTSVPSGTLDLYSVYQTQFQSPKAASPGSRGSIPVYDRTQLEYYVTYYDPNIFSAVTISEEGVMTYTVARPNTSIPSFMNIVFALK